MRNQFRIARTSRKQGGWLLIQLALAMVVISWLAAQDLVKQYDQIADTKAIAVAKGIDVIRNSGNDFLASYYDAIKSGAPIPLPSGGTVEVNTQPSIENLRELGKVPVGSTGKSLIAGGAYKIFISGNPVGCDLADPACNLDGLVCIDAPLRDRATIDFPRLGMAARRIGSDGAFSTLEAPTRISGLGGAWSAENPIADAPGILCARFGYSTSGLATFVRKDGTVAMTGNFNVGGKSIDNVVDVNGTGKVTGSVFKTDLKTVDSACADIGSIASGNGYAMICGVDKKWHIDSGPRANEGALCTGLAQTATSAATGEMLVCNRSGTYTRLSSLISRKVMVSSGLVQDGTVVNKPICGTGGTPDYSFETTQITIDVTENPPKQTMYWTALPMGATWVVKIKLKDNFGGEISGNTVGLTNIMKLECTY